MTSRSLPPSSNTSATFFLALTISSSLVIILSILYFLYQLWHSFGRHCKTIPFDSSAPLKLERFSYKELRHATTEFGESHVVGKGGSGTVFRGVLKDGKTIAIKRLDCLSFQAEREFQNELQILGGLRSPFLVTLLGYCVERDKRVLVYEYMPNRSLQESLFSDDNDFVSLSWDQRFDIIMDVVRGIEFLHLGCDPPVIHGDIKPSNVLLDMDFRAKLSDFGLSRIKVEGEFGVDMFSQDLGRSQYLSQDLSGTLTAGAGTPPAIGTPVETVQEVDFALALQASCSSKSSRNCYNVKSLNLNSVNYDANIASESGNGNGKGKEVSGVDICGDEWNNRFYPCEDELPSVDHSKELKLSANPVYDDGAGGKQWGKDWWWKQDGSDELCSKDYVMEWIGSQICSSSNHDWNVEKKSNPEKIAVDMSPPLDKVDDQFQNTVQDFKFEIPGKKFGKKRTKCRKSHIKKHRQMQDWWKEERLDEISKKGGRFRYLKTKWRKGLIVPHFDLGRRFHFCSRKNLEEQSRDNCNTNREFSFRRGWSRKDNHSRCSDMWSGDLFSRELSSTTSMRGTLCYVAPEYGGFGVLMEKGDIYSLGVLILVIISGRRPLHVLASPMKLEKANLVSWCRHLAQVGNILELVDERLKDIYNKDQASLCINLALACLQKTPELRPDIGDIVKILKGEMELPPVPFEFSPSPPSKLYAKLRKKQMASAE